MGVLEDLQNWGKKTVNDAAPIVTTGVRGMLALPTLGFSEQLIHGREAADASGKAAEAAYAQQQADRAEARRMAEPSPMELQQLENAIKINSSEIARKTKLLESADPALIEAGKQALGLLQGKEAQSLDPIRRQRSKERETLASRLQGQLGTGWETSTPGIQALRNFDESTDNVLAQAQQQTLGSLLGVAQNTSAGNHLDTNAARSQEIARQRGGWNDRAINAFTGNRVDASLPFAGDIARARSDQETWKNVTNLGAQIGGYAAGAGGK